MLWSGVTWAQKPSSTIRFSTTDNDAITVILNDRDFRKVGRSLTFRDLPRKRHQVQIYKVVPNQETGRNRGIPLYSGNIKLEPGKIYDAVLDKQSKNLRVYTVTSLPVLAPAPIPTSASTPVQRSSDGLSDVVVSDLAGSDISVPVNFESNLSTAMLTLKKDMDKETLDKGKMQHVDNYLTSNSVSAYDARAIVSWLLFEDNKIVIADKLKNVVTDKENLDLIADAFSYEKSKTKFLKELN